MATSETILQEVLEAYNFGAPVVEIERYSCGHINDTFCIHVQSQNGPCNYILQRISTAAFKNPDQLMSNVLGVTEYLGKKILETGGDRTREALEVIRPRNGNAYYTDSTGGAWRVYIFIKDIVCYQNAETAELFAAAGRAFGRFQRMLDGYPAETLYETIPNFHDTEDRLEKLKTAVSEDIMGRAKECEAEIAFALAHQADCSVALQALRDGILPLRVTHE